MNFLQFFPGSVRKLLLHPQQIGETCDRVHRCPYLMTHLREKFTLCPALCLCFLKFTLHDPASHFGSVSQNKGCCRHKHNDCQQTKYSDGVCINIIFKRKWGAEGNQIPVKNCIPLIRCNIIYGFVEYRQEIGIRRARQCKGHPHVNVDSCHRDDIIIPVVLHLLFHRSRQTVHEVHFSFIQCRNNLFCILIIFHSFRLYFIRECSSFQNPGFHPVGRKILWFISDDNIVKADIGAGQDKIILSRICFSIQKKSHNICLAFLYQPDGLLIRIRSDISKLQAGKIRDLFEYFRNNTIMVICSILLTVERVPVCYNSNRNRFLGGDIFLLFFRQIDGRYLLSVFKIFFILFLFKTRIGVLDLFQRRINSVQNLFIFRACYKIIRLSIEGSSQPEIRILLQFISQQQIDFFI